MPWEKRSEENNDIQYARKVLDEDHYGLETREREDSGVTGSQNADPERRKARSSAW